MPEYSRAFAEQLAKIATRVAADGLSEPDAQRTVLYLGLLSTEISLKAMLEQAGVPFSKIRRRSHNLGGLMHDLGRCTVAVQVTPGTPKHVPASRLRACTLDHLPAEPTVGELIDAESKGASHYPHQVRYGKLPRHYPPELVAQMATKVAVFAKQHWQSIRAV